MMLRRVVALNWAAWLCVGAGIVGIGWSAWTVWWSQKYAGDNNPPPSDGRTRREFTADHVEQAATLFAGSLALFALAVLVYWVNQRMDNRAPW